MFLTNIAILVKSYKNCDKCDCEVLKVLKENEQLKEEVEVYKKALELYVNWADECDFGYDNIDDVYYKYKEELEKLNLGYIECLIHIAVSEARSEVKK